MIGDTFTSPLSNRTAMLVAAFDSQLKWAGAIRRELESKGFACRVIVPSDIRHSISPGQLADSGGGAVTYLPWTELVAASLQVDVVVLAIQGPHVRRFCHDLFDAVQLSDTVPPITITGWSASSGPSRPPGRAQATALHRRGHLPPDEVPS